MNLAPIGHWAVEKMLPDFYKKSNNYEPLPEHTPLLGIFEDQRLIGYFAVQGHDDGDVEILQGYLVPQYRHKNFHKAAMTLLEEQAKNFGFKKVLLKASRSLKAYNKFMSETGYSPSCVIYEKEII